MAVSLPTISKEILENPAMMQAEVRKPISEIDSALQKIGNTSPQIVTSLPALNTGAFGANSFKSWWIKNGLFMRWSFTLNQTSAGVQGSGPYLFTIPNSSKINTSLLVLDDGSTRNGSYLGGGKIYDGTSYGDISVMAYSSTQLICSLLVGFSSSALTLYWGSAGISFNNTATINASFLVDIPIIGWSS